MLSVHRAQIFLEIFKKYLIFSTFVKFKNLLFLISIMFLSYFQDINRFIFQTLFPILYHRNIYATLFPRLYHKNIFETLLPRFYRRNNFESIQKLWFFLKIYPSIKYIFGTKIILFVQCVLPHHSRLSHVC